MIGIRLGAPDKAASGFFSGVLCEALGGREVIVSVQRSLTGRPRDFSSQRADAFGFRAESSFAEIMRMTVGAELGGWLR